MDKPQLLDTDVLIDYLRGIEPAVQFLAAAQGILLLSAISAAELYAGVKEEEQTQLSRFIDSFDLVEINLSIARQGGLFRNQYFKSHGVGIADALIAASAIQCGARLVTLNQKHFPMLSDLSVPYRK